MMEKIIVLYIIFCIISETGGYNPAPNKYVKYEKVFSEGVFDTTDYSKYYYKSDGENFFTDNKSFIKVKKNDINTLCKFYDNFKDWSAAVGRTKDFDMKKSQITEGDYYRIENWWYGEKEQEDWFEFSKDDDDASTDNASGFKTKTIDETGRMRLVKTSDKDAVRYSLNMYYNVYIYDTENSTLYYLHNDT